MTADHDAYVAAWVRWRRYALAVGEMKRAGRRPHPSFKAALDRSRRSVEVLGEIRMHEIHGRSIAW